MAIRNILKSTAQGILGKNLRRVAGGFASLIGGPNKLDSSDFAGINRSKQATNMLAFPLDVVNQNSALGNHGHYIMFFINEQTNAKLKFDNINQEIDELAGFKNIEKHMSQNLGFKSRFDKAFDSKTGKFKEKASEAQKTAFDMKGGVGDIFFNKDRTKSSDAAQKIINNKLATGSINKGKVNTRKNFKQTVSVDRRPTRRLDSCISLFMPADVKVSYKSNYTDTSIGAGTQAASQILGEVIRTGSVSTDTVGKATGDLATAVAVDGALQLISGIPSLAGAKEAVELGMGAIVADRMEMAFKGIEKRKFQYTFKMLPRSKDEADEVKKIIDMFKFHMLPEMLDGNARGRLMSYPSTFDIKYMYQNAENTYLNKVSECYLESMDVDYGGDRYKTHEGTADGAPPVETTIILQFGEIELITRERAEEGF